MFPARCDYTLEEKDIKRIKKLISFALPPSLEISELGQKLFRQEPWPIHEEFENIKLKKNSNLIEK